MSGRPTELDLALDAIDEAFRQAVTQFAKNFATASNLTEFKAGYDRVRKARVELIGTVKEASKER